MLLARNLSAEGRSRAFVGGASVPVAKLAEPTEALVAVHGQSDQHRLLQQRAQREALDRFGGERAGRRCWRPTRDLYHRLDGPPSASSSEVVSTSARERAREADLLRFGLGEIEAVASDEPVRTSSWRPRSPGWGSPTPCAPPPSRARESLSERRRRRRRAVHRPRRPGPSSTASASTTRRPGELADRLAEITYLLSDVAADVASYASRLETDPPGSPRSPSAGRP